jgi:hypothetical protein
MNKPRNLNIIIHKQLLKDTFVFVGHGDLSDFEVAINLKGLNKKVFKLQYLQKRDRLERIGNDFYQYRLYL